MLGRAIGALLPIEHPLRNEQLLSDTQHTALERFGLPGHPYSKRHGRRSNRRTLPWQREGSERQPGAKRGLQWRARPEGARPDNKNR